MRAVRFLDTNILLYAISSDPADVQKRDRALALLDRDDNALSAQVLSEFYLEATRPTRTDALPHELAAGLVGTWSRFPVQAITMDIVREAMRIRAEHGYSYWDSAVIAAAMAAGCRELCSEDMRHGHEIEAVRIVNPFR